MGSADDLRRALLLLQQACAEVQRAAEAALRDLETAPRAAAAPGADPPPAVPPPAPDGPLPKLRRFHGPALQAGLDPEDLVFADRAEARHLKLADENKPALLEDCARRLDELLWKYHYLLPAPLKAQAAEILRELAAAAGPLPDSGVRVPSELPAGSVVEEISPVRRLLSSGRPSPVGDLLAAAARTAARLDSAPPAERGAALAELMKLRTDLADADAAKEATVLRFAVNALHPLGGAGLAPLLQALKERGFSELEAPVGAVFDDGYSPSRYERRRVRSGERRNVIVQLVRRGFAGPDGVAVQRAIVAVSDGGG